MVSRFLSYKKVALPGAAAAERLQKYYDITCLKHVFGLKNSKQIFLFNNL
jgi:hypothetical protein